MGRIDCFASFAEWGRPQGTVQWMKWAAVPRERESEPFFFLLSFCVDYGLRQQPMLRKQKRKQKEKRMSEWAPQREPNQIIPIQSINPFREGWLMEEWIGADWIWWVVVLVAFSVGGLWAVAPPMAPPKREDSNKQHNNEIKWKKPKHEGSTAKEFSCWEENGFVGRQWAGCKPQQLNSNHSTQLLFCFH